MKIVKLQVFFLYLENNHTLFCVFTAETQSNLSLTDDEIKQDLKRIYEIYTKEKHSFILDEVSEILYKYTEDLLSPKMIGYFDNNVWEDSRNSF